MEKELNKGMKKMNNYENICNSEMVAYFPRLRHQHFCLNHRMKSPSRKNHVFVVSSRMIGIPDKDHFY